MNYLGDSGRYESGIASHPENHLQHFQVAALVQLSGEDCGAFHSLDDRDQSPPNRPYWFHVIP